MSAAETIRRVDQQLIAHEEFGDSEKILVRGTERYAFGLDLFVQHLPALATLETALQEDSDRRRLLFGDPVVRMSMESAFARLARGMLEHPDELENVLPLAASVLPLMGTWGPTQAQMARRFIVGQEQTIWLWCAGPSDAPLIGKLMQRFKQEFARDGRRANICDPDEQTVAALDRACALLIELLPASGRSVLRHVSSICLARIAMAEGTLLSASAGDDIPGTLFLSPDVLQDPWETAGRLLHEGLHLKLFDIARSHALLKSAGATVAIPWRPAPWPVMRALFAFHVYVHLALFQVAVEGLRGGDAQAAGSARHQVALSPASCGSNRTAPCDSALERARYLGENLLTTWSAHLTADGERLVRWLLLCMDPWYGSSASIRAGRNAPAEIAQTEEPDQDMLATYCRDPRNCVRALDELGCLLVFTPHAPRLHWLSLQAWAIFELCDGKTNEQTMYAVYADLVGPHVPQLEARRQLRAGLAQLISGQIITRTKEYRHGEPGTRQVAPDDWPHRRPYGAGSDHRLPDGAAVVPA